ncbi:helix-turn-helix transcriptional regulator [Burkholderia territorii]|uniref:helix-turn-helix transcriptional regulator n=1 Tax=Burkholderia territorii TaxID=1503055 RepID=UPI00075758D0|nr:helix-turn-helix transcriptional regulator [Burkholderia territorii]KVQ59223.1 LuxR family transcriptional regulator [Burkholderia territorii]KWA38673.1 LuxR family transcriptional regulator [Burkholderia territorii]
MERDQLIGDLYEAALCPDGFLEVFHRVSESLGANVFHMFSWDAVRNAPKFSIYSPRAELDSIVALYDQYYGALDPRRGFVENAPLGEFVCCQDHLTERDVERSEFFQDYQIPSGIRYLMGMRFARPGSDDILLGLLRAYGRPPYSPEERANLTGMAGHLQRAINLWQDARVLRRDAALGNELMEELGLSIFTLDRHSRVVYVNAAAEALLRATTCLKLEHGHLSATSAPQNDALKAAVTRVARTRKSENLALAGTVSAAHEVFLGIASLSGQIRGGALGDAAILITARRRSAAPLVVAQQLRQAFGLTSAEAAVAEALIGGKTPEECAAIAGVSLSTVRTQLRAIYEKTHSRNQAEAVGRMLWILPRHARDE